MRKAVLALGAAFMLLFFAGHGTSQPSSKIASVVIVGEGMKGAEISVPRGATVAIRLEGRDAAGQPVAVDSARVKWRAPRSPDFRGEIKDGKLHLTALSDPFDTADGSEPTGMVMASYEGKTAGAAAAAVLNVEGAWRLMVTSDVIDLELRQSGRWIKDIKGRQGELRGRRLTLKVRETISVLGIPATLTLYPKIRFTDRDSGVGTVEVPLKTESLKVKRIVPAAR